MDMGGGKIDLVRPIFSTKKVVCVGVGILTPLSQPLDSSNVSLYVVRTVRTMNMNVNSRVRFKVEIGIHCKQCEIGIYCKQCSPK